MGQWSGEFTDKGQQFLLDVILHFAVIRCMADKKEPKTINVRLDLEATILVRAAKKKSRRSLNAEASWALVEFYTPKPKTP
jgi:hypothetical protein